MNVQNPITRGRPFEGMAGRLKRGRKKVAVFLWGILIGSVLMNPISVKAYGLNQSLHYEDGIPDDLRIYFDLVGQEFNICPELLEAMAYRESRFTADAVNKKCVGLMQINTKVHKERIEKYGWTEEDMYDPYKNLMIAGDYLAELYSIYEDDNPIVLAVYSGNWKAVAKYKEYGFMCEYANDVLTRSAEYERLHKK